MIIIKRSRFIRICNGYNNELILLNTYTGDLLTIPSKDSERLEYLLDNPNTNKYSKLKEELMKREIIIDDAVNETARAELKYMELAHSTKKLLLTILPTEDCNFRCQYCYEEHNFGKMTRTVINGIKNYLRKNLYRYDMLQVNWFGGEPIEALDILVELSNFFIDICAEQKKPYRASMTTNGYSLNAELFKQLYQLHIVDYQVTLDGLENAHNLTRPHKDGANSYKQIVYNLKEIRDKIKTNNINITIRTNITKSVLIDFDKHLDFLANEFGYDDRFGVLFKIAWSNEKDTKFNSEELLPTGELHKILEKCKYKGLRFSINREQICSISGICYAAHSNAFVIGADGTLYKCTVEYKKDINQIGSIKENGNLVIDKDKWAFWVTKPVFQGEYEKCTNCFFQPACMGIYCPINRFNEKGQHQCVGMKDYVDIYMLLCSQSKNMYERMDING